MKASSSQRWPRIVLPALVLLGVLISGQTSAFADSGVGITPSSIVFEEVLPGSSSQKTLEIHNFSESAQEVTVTKTGAVAEWISFEPAGPVSVGGKSSIRLVVVIRPSQSVAPGTYAGEVQVSVGSGGQITAGAGARIAPGAVLPVVATVGGTIRKELGFVSAEVESAEIGRPVPITLTLVNTGNVDAAGFLSVEILNTTQDTVVTTFETALDPVAPAVRAAVPVDMPAGVLEEQTNYWARLKVSMDGTEIGSATKTFDVLKSGDLPCIAVLTSISAPSMVRVGEEVQIGARVTNIAAAPVTAEYRGQATLSGNAVAELISPVVSIAPFTDGTLFASFVPSEAGQYVIGGTAYYGPDRFEDCTERKTAFVMALEEEAAVTAGWGTKDYGVVAGLAVIALLVVAVLVRQEQHVRKRASSAHPEG